MGPVSSVCHVQANGTGNGNGATANGNGASSGNGSGTSPLPEEDSTGVRRLLKLLKVDLVPILILALCNSMHLPLLKILFGL